MSLLTFNYVHHQPKSVLLDAFYEKPVELKIKDYVFGRAVLRLTYPVRRMISDLIMFPYVCTVSQTKKVWKNLENYHVAVRLTCATLTAIGSLFIGIIAGAAVAPVRFVGSIIQAPFRDNIHELDTYLERYFFSEINPHKSKKGYFNASNLMSMTKCLCTCFHANRSSGYYSDSSSEASTSDPE